MVAALVEGSMAATVAGAGVILLAVPHALPPVLCGSLMLFAGGGRLALVAQCWYSKYRCQPACKAAHTCATLVQESCCADAVSEVVPGTCGPSPADAVASRLEKAEAQNADLYRRLEVALAELAASSERERLAREASAAAAVRPLVAETATKATMAHILPACTTCSTQASSPEMAEKAMQSMPVATLHQATQSPPVAMAHEATQAPCSLADAAGVDVRSAPVLGSPEPRHGSRTNVGAAVQTEAAAAGPTEDVVASNEVRPYSGTSPAGPVKKDDLVAKLTQMAAASPDLRDKLQASLKERLRAPAPGTSPAAESPQTSPAPGASPVVKQESTSAMAEAPGVASAARTEIIARLADLTEANRDLRQEAEKAASGAAALRQRAAESEKELTLLKADHAALAAHAAETDRELRASRRLAAARAVFTRDSEGPRLSVHWTADAGEEWPGGNAPAIGAEKLRTCLEGRSARLSLGAPPAEWRTWLQLGLRRGQPSDPAMMRLAVPDVDDGAYIGLLWAAPGGA
eukprot:gnl/TRDRNA2_/TRDRNA2_161886_c0_seq1.p1 gnl/TRDRNA2_/TRDRNA2_161886_c0~~gnl/TRDRNA2_/TRDRNA2_161886_c0_seq1.p1  ORF type:complete len:541 (-),score=97.27 gnl/TRDRNA2_/TRDRNA2_161886_c0_seq1:82-1638(-)